MIIKVADKQTLDRVEGKCDKIIESVSHRQGLDDVEVFIIDFVYDEIEIMRGSVDSVRRTINA